VSDLQSSHILISDQHFEKTLIKNKPWKGGTERNKYSLSQN